jgi:hypothetical protein
MISHHQAHLLGHFQPALDHALRPS